MYKNRERRQRIFTYKTLRAGPISGAARMFPGAQRAPPAYFTHKKRSARIFTYKSASVFLRIKNAPRFLTKDLRLKHGLYLFNRSARLPGSLWARLPSRVPSVKKRRSRASETAGGRAPKSTTEWSRPRSLVKKRQIRSRIVLSPAWRRHRNPPPHACSNPPPHACSLEDREV